MERINYGKRRIEYSIERCRRKRTLAINITSSAQVIVLAPYSLSNVKIKDVIRKKTDWILQKKEYFKRLSLQFPDKEFISGEQLLFLGRKHRLKIKEAKGSISDSPSLTGRRVFISVAKHLTPYEKKNKIRGILIKWYFSKTARIVEQRLKRYSKMLNLVPSEIKIKDQKRRWGSCSGNGTLRFNWKIAMAPISVIDYIVVHELCHLKVKNHSTSFWRQVSLALPDYQRRRKWLRDNANLFRL